MATNPTNPQDLIAIARERVRVGPPPDWKVPCYQDGSFAKKPVGPITYLLIDNQVHVETRQIFHRWVMRLETQEAVQHKAQWRVQFEPQTQSLILHSVKTRRGDAEVEHASLEKLQFLQREAGLEGF